MSADKFKEISTAYAVLSDAAVRRPPRRRPPLRPRGRGMRRPPRHWAPGPGRTRRGPRPGPCRPETRSSSLTKTIPSFTTCSVTWTAPLPIGSTERRRTRNTSWENVESLLFCGMEQQGLPRRLGAVAPSVLWSEWLMNNLGIKADESVVASAYTSKSHSKGRTRTYMEDGEWFSMVSTEKHRNRIDDRFVGVHRRQGGWSWPADWRGAALSLGVLVDCAQLVLNKNNGFVKYWQLLALSLYV